MNARVICAAVAAGLLFLYWRGWRTTVKAGAVVIWGPGMARAQPLIERAHYECDIGRGPVVTSGREGEHVAGSLHYNGEAGDYRTRDLTSWQVMCLVGRMRALLGSAYQVIDENTTSNPHIHVEYQP